MFPEHWVWCWCVNWGWASMFSCSLCFNFLWFSVMASCSKRSFYDEGVIHTYLQTSGFLYLTLSSRQVLLKRCRSNRDSSDLELELGLWMCRVLRAVGDEKAVFFKSERVENEEEEDMDCVWVCHRVCVEVREEHWIQRFLYSWACNYSQSLMQPCGIKIK